MFDHLVPFTFNLLLFILKILINFLKKQATLMKRSTVVNLPLQHRFVTEELFTEELNIRDMTRDYEKCKE